MATVSTVNLVKVTAVKYGDANLLTGVVPSTLKEIGVIKSGTLNVDIPEATVKTEMDEITQAVYRASTEPVVMSGNMELPTLTSEQVAAFTGAVLVAGTAGTTPDELTFSGQQNAANKYFVISGINTVGKKIDVIFPNAMISWSWSGALGQTTDTVPFKLKLTAMADATVKKAQLIIKPECTAVV